MRARRYDPTATASSCTVCGSRLDHAMYPYCVSHLPLEHPVRRPAPPPGGVFCLADVSADLPQIEAWARAEAGERGYRPRRSVAFTSDLDEYEELVGQPALELEGGRRGLCGPGARGRIIWVAPAPRWDLFETITHELAHAVLPLRCNHSEDWLGIHVATLARVTSPSHAGVVERRNRTQYGL